ncbi:hypothetical protein E2K80_14095 [Rhodophyticola sp. CCM32]|uniref:hypothetical protein n=1 Tax=Rhodophyticola sp. CCM32 TaxID=2916397 RepID=UPI00107F69C6|nr:hypothetical protein [Rhodophyticola sp. CCM32]QBY01718.1 hypothetical protein E2K80_14095 [Rhodophyticola sp. CCM32]
MSPLQIKTRILPFGRLLRLLAKPFTRSKTSRRRLPPPVDIPDYLRSDVGLLPRTRRPRVADPPRINPLNLR